MSASKALQSTVTRGHSALRSMYVRTMTTMHLHIYNSSMPILHFVPEVFSTYGFYLTWARMQSVSRQVLKMCRIVCPCPATLSDSGWRTNSDDIALNNHSRAEQHVTFWNIRQALLLDMSCTCVVRSKTLQNHSKSARTMVVAPRTTISIHQNRLLHFTNCINQAQLCNISIRFKSKTFALTRFPRGHGLFCNMHEQ